MFSRLPKLALMISLAFGTQLHAQSLLRVDFGKSTPPASPVQTGFESFALSVNTEVGPIVQTYDRMDTPGTGQGRISVTLAAGRSLTDTGNMLARDRELSASRKTFEYAALYRDLVIAHNRQHMSIGIAGLAPDTVYDVRIFSSDTAEGGTTLISNATGAGSESGTITWEANYHVFGTDVAVFSTTLRIRTDREGGIVLLNNRVKSDNVNRQAIINGLEILAVP